MKPLSIVTLVLFIACVGCSKKNSTINAELTQFGLFEEVRRSASLVTTTSAGYVNEVSEHRLIKQTDLIPARLKTTFGITFIISGPKNGTLLETRTRLIHPIITNPQTGESFTVDENTDATAVGKIHYDAFTFDNSWEIAPGNWTFQIFQGERLLLEKVFDVKPET